MINDIYIGYKLVLISLFSVPDYKKGRLMFNLLFGMLVVVYRFIPENVLKHVIYSNLHMTELFWNQLFNDIKKIIKNKSS